MQWHIELKHVGPKAHVRHLLEELIARLEERLGHFPQEALSLRVVFEENGSHKLYRTSLTCHLPGGMAAAHIEHRDPGMAIRRAFSDVNRQLEKRKASLRHEHDRRHLRRARLVSREVAVGGKAASART